MNILFQKFDSKEKFMYTMGIITSSDKGYKGEREDESGKLIKEIVERYNMKVERYVVLPDEKE